MAARLREMADELDPPTGVSRDPRMRTLYAFLGAIGVNRECGKCTMPLFPGRTCANCGHDPGDAPRAKALT